MQYLTVLYDGRCPLCGWASRWLSGQRQLTQLYFVPAGSYQARQMFPQLDHEKTLKDITVVSDDGQVFQNDKAWLMCLWALKRYRHMSYKLAGPGLAPRVRSFVAMVSKYRPVKESNEAGCADGYCH